MKRFPNSTRRHDESRGRKLRKVSSTRHSKAVRIQSLKKFSQRSNKVYDAHEAFFLKSCRILFSTRENCESLAMTEANQKLEYRDKLFALIHGLPVPEEPEQHLDCGPSAPHPMEKFWETMAFERAMGKSSNSTGSDVAVSALMEKILAPRDSRDNPGLAPLRTNAPANPFFEPLVKRAPLEDGSAAIRYEIVTIDNNRWRHGYDAQGELVSAYLLSSGDLG
jgi:hypothetical protein